MLIYGYVFCFAVAKKVVFVWNYAEIMQVPQKKISHKNTDSFHPLNFIKITRIYRQTHKKRWAGINPIKTQKN